MIPGAGAGSGLRDLGDGLILRRALPADTEALVAFHADVHRHEDAPDELVGAWVRDLMRGDHPTFDPQDFTVVEDTRTGAIVSSLNLIPQTWTYGGIRFGVGRVELVSTHPDYRRRGLVRAQFEVIHAWSDARGYRLQAITGIPYYYRQFGYEMGLALGGGRLGYKVHVPKLKAGEEEPFRIRPAAESDLVFLAQLYVGATKRHLVACERDLGLWRYELLGRSDKNANRMELRVVEGADAERVGFLAHPPRLWGPTLTLSAYELRPGISWLGVTPSVLRYLKATGEAYAARDGKEEFGAFYFSVGTEHPVYDAISDRLPRVRKPYAWYVRVPDLCGFLEHVKPVLERRLAASLLAGHTGELEVSFYRDGLRLVFERGQLTAIEPWMPMPGAEGKAGFPDLTFLQLLFGYRSLEELRHAFADCWAAADEAMAVLNVLFPQQVSDVWPVA
jgi:GNAT superfamily N-acetyltransferase